MYVLCMNVHVYMYLCMCMCMYLLISLMEGLMYHRLEISFVAKVDHSSTDLSS